MHTIGNRIKIVVRTTSLRLHLPVPVHIAQCHVLSVLRTVHVHVHHDDNDMM
jgi:hypothetical protein